MAVAKIRFVGEDDASKVAGKVGKSFNKLDKNLKSTGNRSEGLRLRISRLRNSLLLGSFAIGGFGFALAKVISNTSDLQEELQKFGVVFGNVSTQATKASQDLAKGFGLSEISSVKLLGTTGDLLTGLGFISDEALNLSVEINTLAGDLASFSNLQGGTSRASSILTKALLGEREALASLGIKILETDIKQRALQKGVKITNGEIDRQEKALITLELATEQSKNAIGDFERSQNSFANQSRVFTEALTDLSTILGENILPAFGKVLVVVNKLIKGYINLLRENDIQGRSVEQLEARYKVLIKTIADLGQSGLVEQLSIEALAIQKQIAFLKQREIEDKKALQNERKAAAAKAKAIADAQAERDAIKARADAREKELDILVQELDLIEAGVIKRNQASVKLDEEAEKEAQRNAKTLADRQQLLNAAPFEAFGAAVGGVFQALEDSIANTFIALANGTASGKQLFADFGKAVLAIVARLIARLTVLAALTAFLGPGGGILGQGAASLLGFQSPEGVSRVIPGPSTQAVPVIAHGGERLGRENGGGVTIQIMGNVFNSEETIEEIARGMAVIQDRSGVG